MHRTVRTRVPMNDSQGVAFYASGNIASEALRLYCIAQTYGQKHARRKLYAVMYNVCMLFVLGSDLLYNKVPCQM